jgi:hypothetical protein
VAPPLAGELDVDDDAQSPEAQFSRSCWTNGSLVRKRPNASSWPDSGRGTASGSEIPSPPTFADAAVALPPLRVGAAIGPVAVAVVDGVDEADSFALGGCSIFIVRGTWNASRPSRSTPPMPAMIFCFLAFALGSIFLAMS